MHRHLREAVSQLDSESLCFLAYADPAFAAAFAKTQALVADVLGHRFKTEALDRTHITLDYVGNVPSAVAREVFLTVRDATIGSKPVMVKPKNVGWFPPGPHSDGKYPVVLHYEYSEELQRLVQLFRTAVMPWSASRTFMTYVPHSTLGYYDGAMQDEDKTDAAYQPVPAVPFTVKTVTLTGRGWRKIGDYSLGG